MSIADIPRGDRGAIWGRAEELQRRDPGLRDWAAMSLAVQDYASGRVHLSEPVIVQAARDRPESMFQGAR